eukprot:TRINITY_DN213_c0_g1_i2.p1 TRINITY_DN213_c0_g1~~TRINITY_DN213_c0_g1_i2.p1  ORF type:complete len:103 (+),score=8.39 TRINITY_DN213_c0_g1_i2:117-425(+)
MDREKRSSSYRCDICDKAFTSWKHLAEHRESSAEHHAKEDAIGNASKVEDIRAARRKRPRHAYDGNTQKNAKRKLNASDEDVDVIDPPPAPPARVSFILCWC